MRNISKEAGHEEIGDCFTGPSGLAGGKVILNGSVNGDGVMRTKWQMFRQFA